MAILDLVAFIATLTALGGLAAYSIHALINDCKGKCAYCSQKQMYYYDPRDICEFPRTK